MTEKKLIDEQLKEVSAGAKIGIDRDSLIATQLLRDAGDKAWALLGNEVGGLWYYINRAEKATLTIIRKVNIEKALNSLESFKDSLSENDYLYIKMRLTESDKLTK